MPEKAHVLAGQYMKDKCIITMTAQSFYRSLFELPDKKGYLRFMGRRHLAECYEALMFYC